MTDMEILEILERNCSNLEKALAFRQAFQANKPSALNLKPQKERKKREARKPMMNLTKDNGEFAEAMVKKALNNVTADLPNGHSTETAQ